MSNEKKNEQKDQGVDEAAVNDIQDKIDMAMEKIVSDAQDFASPQDGSLAQGEESSGEDAHGTAKPVREERREAAPVQRENQVPFTGAPSSKKKSARPRPISYVPVEEGEMELPVNIKKKKKHKGIKVVGIVAGMVIIAAGAAYAGMSYYYSDKFFEGTTINGIDCSGMTAYEVEQAIASRVEDYSLEIAARNQEPQTITGDKIEYRYMSNGDVLKYLKAQKPYEWLRGYFEKKSYEAQENISYNKEMLQNEIKQLNCAKPENQVAPENAYVAFKENQFEIVPETQGSTLDLKKAYKLLDNAIANSQVSVDFNKTPKAYVQAAVTKDDPGLKSTVDAYNNFTRASITYTFGEQTVTLDSTTIKDWLQFDEKGQLVQNDASFQQHIVDFVANLAAQYDTVGTDREFYTTSGRTVYVYGSAYGWKIDQAAEVAQLTQEIQSGTQTTREPVYSMRANSRGYNDLGDTYIEVDMSAQHMYYYQNGSIILDTDIVTGDMTYSDRQTPPGIFTLYYKESPAVLKGDPLPGGGYEYESPVTFWMPFNGGIGFHDANWQPYFGGDRFYGGGSHGCINMPYSAAEALYYSIDYGVPIICFY